MRKTLWITLYIFVYISLQAQIEPLPKKIKLADYQHVNSFLLIDFGQHKDIPDKLEPQTLIALSRYPELKEININFKFKKIKTTMACRPAFFSIFRKGSKRKYNIFINNHTKELKSICTGNLSINAQVGVISHELAHVVDYMERNSFQIIGVGIKYNSKTWRGKFEKSIDSIAISKGFGWQIYDFSDYVLNYSNVPDEYKTYKKKTYYKPEDILLKINDLILQNRLFYFNLSFPK